MRLANLINCNVHRRNADKNGQKAVENRNVGKASLYKTWY